MLTKTRQMFEVRASHMINDQVRKYREVKMAKANAIAAAKVREDLIAKGIIKIAVTQ